MRAKEHGVGKLLGFTIGLIDKIMNGSLLIAPQLKRNDN
jgi:hypothetical protein